MKAAALIATILSISTGTTWSVDGAHTPKPTPVTIAAPASTSVSQLPLLFIVDGVRYASDQVPLLSADLVASVQVVKGRQALEQYGPDASYGVVVVTTKLAQTRRS